MASRSFPPALDRVQAARLQAQARTTARRLARSLALKVPPLAKLRAERNTWRRRARVAGRRLSEERRLRVDAERQAERLRAGMQQARSRVAALTPSPGVRVKIAFRPGDPYSTIPDLVEVRERHAEIFDREMESLPGIDLRVPEQLALVPRFAELYAEQPFQDEPVDGLRYGFVNMFFGAGSGIALYCMLRHLQPARLVEVGSGWSSALALDVNDRFLDGKMQCTFVDPAPDRLYSLLRPADHERTRIFDKPLYAVGSEPFADLRAGDLLFIDSSHVSRVGSDVNHLFLDVIPSLPAGVYVHVHDIFWPFEYPEDWVYGGRGWNEIYLLRALLTHNARLEIVWFNDYLYRKHFDAIAPHMPHWARGNSSSIYMRTT